MDPRLTEVMAEINKQAPGTVVLGKDLKNFVHPRVTTGSVALDASLGGGWPAGVWNELIGDESHGKTGVVLKTIAKNMEDDPEWTTAWIAAEPFDYGYAEMCGVDLSRVAIVETNVMEEAYSHAVRFLDRRAVDGLVIDSLPALVPSDEADPGKDDPFEVWQQGLGARLTGKFFRVQGKAMKRSLVEEDRLCTGWVINQWREKIGVRYGDPRTTPGGRGKNFFYYTRLVVKRDEFITESRPNYDDEVRVGQVIKTLTLKNKSFAPQKTATMHFYFDDAENGNRAGDYDLGMEIAALGVVHGLVEKKGAWYIFGDEKFQGQSRFAEAIREDPVLFEKMRDEVLAASLKKSAHGPIVEEDAPKPRKKVARRRRG